MKFDTHPYWKHDNCRDVFIAVTGVSFDDNGKDAFLWITWMTQGTASYWSTGENDRIKVTSEHYGKWKYYEPKGEYRF